MIMKHHVIKYTAQNKRYTKAFENNDAKFEDIFVE